MNVLTTAMMAWRANQLGSTYIHQLFCLNSVNIQSAHRKAELAIIKLMQNPVKLNVLRSLELLLLDEAGQMSAELLSVLDIILRRIRSNNIFLGGILLLCTMDHTQLAPVVGRPFLVSSHIVSCFSMVGLKHSVCASLDTEFQRVQVIARMHPNEYNRHLLDEFSHLCSTVFKFVDDWDAEEITPTTVRLYGKKHPGRQATQSFVQQVKETLPANEVIERVADDVECAQMSHQEWHPATDRTSAKLNSSLKEPQTLLFFRGAVYEFTYNDPDNRFTQSSLCVLFELPSPISVMQFQRVKVLAAPVGLKDYEFDSSKTLDEYVAEGWYETSVSTAQERPIAAGDRVQAQRRQYGLRHRVTSTIHASMGDTLMKVAIQISDANRSFKLWDKAQVIVALSRTKQGKDTIFVGNKQSTIKALRMLIQLKNQWTDYMESVLRVVSIDSNCRDRLSTPLYQAREHPFRVCDIPLPDCNTGFVYMLISCQDKTFSYIGQTSSIRRRLCEHNSGYGSLSTSPIELRPYAVFALVCGFDGNDRLRRRFESLWQYERDELRRRGVICLRQWALCANRVIENVQTDPTNQRRCELRLLLFFEDE